MRKHNQKKITDNNFANLVEKSMKHHSHTYKKLAEYEKINKAIHQRRKKFETAIEDGIVRYAKTLKNLAK